MGHCGLRRVFTMAAGMALTQMLLVPGAAALLRPPAYTSSAALSEYGGCRQRCLATSCLYQQLSRSLKTAQISVRMSEAKPPEPADGNNEGFLDLSVLQQRMQEVRKSDEQREADEKVAQMLEQAANWRMGRCSQRTVLLLSDWVRRLRCERGLLVCGTYSGDVHLSDVASGELLQSWSPEPHGPDGTLSEITAIDFDGEHVSSGDAGGALYLRTRNRLAMAARHAGVVTGVHWRGGDVAYSCAADRRLVAWDVKTGAETATMVAQRPIISMSVCEDFAALGLDDGSVVLCSLSPMREMFSFDAHDSATSAVKLVTVSMLISSDASGEVKLWRLDEDESTGRRCTLFKGHSAPVVCLDGDAEKIVSGARDGTVRVWDIESESLRFMLRGFTAYIGSVQCSPSWLIADGTNNAVVLMDFAAQGEDEAESSS